MILYNNVNKDNIKQRLSRTIAIDVEEKPQRPVYDFKSNKERYKYCVMIKNMVRTYPEYRTLISFIKKHMNMNKCIVFNNLQNGEGKHYTIELHHWPYTLIEIINVVVSKRQMLGETLNPYDVIDEVFELHYDGKVGLINLSVTAHELAESGKVFIPLQWIYQRYDVFTEEYEEYMDDTLKQKIELLIQMSQASDKIASNILDPEFTYIKVDGWDLPEVPDKWKDLLKDLSIEDGIPEK